MPITPEQRALLKAVIQQDLSAVQNLLDQGADPDFPTSARSTPLHEAVRHNDLEMVRMLVKAGACVDRRNRDGVIPLDMAYNTMANLSIIRFLEKAHEKLFDKNGNYKPKKHKEKKLVAKEPAVAEIGGLMVSSKTLPDIFKPENWMGKVGEMQKLWDSVPKNLKKEFDYAAALAKARQETLKKKFPKMTVRKKTSKSDPKP